MEQVELLPLQAFLGFLGEGVEADDVLEVPQIRKREESLDSVLVAEACGNFRVSQAIGQVLLPEGFVQGNQGQSIQRRK